MIDPTALVSLILSAILGAAALAPAQPDRASPAPAADLSGAHDFDFLVGEWRVKHRYLRAATGHWAETDGTCTNRRLMEGRANLEEHWMNPPSGAYRALGLRAFDPKTGEWSIWWLDGRDPAGKLDPPLRGRFENRIGTFYADDVLDGKSMRKRFVWSRITATSARWEQSYSWDAGKTWAPNWIMEFQRVTATSTASGSPTAPATAVKPTASVLAPGLHDFDFLIGDWLVHHRRVSAESHQWVEFAGTCSNRTYLEGSANVEEHMLESPAGAYRALGIRAYDPKSQLWSIWWLDGRYPSIAIDPPVRGRFENGVGRFYSDYEDHGRPMRVRFTWSEVTPSSARWEQASSADAGKTWETNWIMEFRRAS